ncbi:hypothetical protein EPUL_004087 [Erysiphe pulchra]|uniref:DUF3752 domain-containing protein n=1 Tax=Erysiphe pulchra TaxID=225359 RepID=A0A2S4PUW7_9PEZI|nr:hypothetical protein EPUL_004087 [Erysiphe pulchra]
MPFVGPKLPPHLLSRKNPLQNNSFYGTSLPQTQSDSSSRKIGPCLPTQRGSTSESLDVSEGIDPEITTENSSIDEIQRPSQPTKQFGGQSDSNSHSSIDYLKNSTIVTIESQSNLVKPSTAASITRRIFGPALPPTLQAELQSKSLNSGTGNDNSTDSEEDYGPSLPPSHDSITYSSVISQETNKEQPCNSQNEKLDSTSKLKRAEWMLTPPTSSDLTTRFDPTKLKSRKFTSGRGTKRPAEASGVSTIWTETPEEKRQRLEDEVLGRKDAISSSSSLKATTNPSELARSTQSAKEREATKEQIYKYNKQNRNKSLFEERKAAQDRGELEILEDDDPSRRVFDKEKDMALGGKHINTAKRKQLLMHATNFGNRFQEGKYL